MGLIIEIAFIFVLLIILFVNIGLLIFRNDLKQTPNETQKSGMEIARIISSKYTKEEPHIIKKKGLFLDHYNVSRNCIKLSPEVFDGTDMYAGVVAMNVALETSNKKVSQRYYFATFVVLVSYILITIGAFLNNASIINFGLVVFIFAFLLVVFTSTIYNKNDEIFKDLKKEKVLKPFSEENILLASLIVVARLPYGFINYFR